MKRWGISKEHCYQKKIHIYKQKFQKNIYKNSVGKFNNKLEETDEKISELERGSVENVWLEVQRKDRKY